MKVAIWNQTKQRKAMNLIMLCVVLFFPSPNEEGWGEVLLYCFKSLFQIRFYIGNVLNTN